MRTVKVHQQLVERVGSASHEQVNMQDDCTPRPSHPRYMSPDMCASLNYDYKADVWSMACIVYELFRLYAQYQ